MPHSLAAPRLSQVRSALLWDVRVAACRPALPMYAVMRPPTPTSRLVSGGGPCGRVRVCGCCCCCFWHMLEHEWQLGGHMAASTRQPRGCRSCVHVVAPGFIVFAGRAPHVTPRHGPHGLHCMPALVVAAASVAAFVRAKHPRIFPVLQVAGDVMHTSHMCHEQLRGA